MKNFFYLFVVVLIYMSSCGSNKSVVKKYYVIEQLSSDTILSAETSPIFNEYCHLEEINIYPAYASRQIVNRNRSHEIRYYQDHEWAVRPQLFLEHIISDYLIQNRVFNNVSSRYWQVDPKFSFETTVYNLEVIEEGSTFAAHIHFTFTLRENDTNRLLVKHSADVTKPLEKKDLNLLAETISNILIQELKVTVDKIRQKAPIME